MAQTKTELEVYKRICKDFNTVIDVGVREDLDYFLINQFVEYHLFEPNPKYANILREKIKWIDHNITINEIGLSDVKEDGKIYYENVESFKIHHSVPSHDMGHRLNLDTLDNYVEQKRINHIDFLKIDCEGLDYQIMDGATKTIKERNMIDYVQVEYSLIKDFVGKWDTFKWFLMMEPALFEAIKPRVQYYNHYSTSLVELNDDIISFLDNVMFPTGNGGNLFGINQTRDLISPEQLLFLI